MTALHLSSLPWALGGMPVWSQFMSLGFSILGFALAVARAREEENSIDISPAARSPGVILRRFPFFWAGLTLLGYIAVQGANPSWRFHHNSESWWLEPITHIGWLPSGVAAPFEWSNPWRALTIFGSLWLLVCSVWAGFSRRKSYRILFSLLAGNALLLALLGLLQKIAGATEIFGMYRPGNDRFFSSFIYPNHAGPYFNLMTALAVGLAWWHNERALRALERAGKGAVFAFLAFFASAAVVFSYSRTSIILLATFIGITGLILAIRFFRRTESLRERPELVPLVIIAVSLFGIGLVSFQTDKVRERFAALAANPVALTRDRTLARQATLDMGRDRWLFGWGAGCFRHIFPLYAQHYPEIYTAANGERKYWEHAHDDLLEFPAELGALGLLPLAAILGSTIWQLSRRRFWRNAVPLSLGIAGGLLLLHAWVDFVFQNPAVLFTWAVLLAGAIRWTEFDQQPTLRRNTG